jgi:hypothetical protein
MKCYRNKVQGHSHTATQPHHFGNLLKIKSFYRQFSVNCLFLIVPANEINSRCFDISLSQTSESSLRGVVAGVRCAQIGHASKLPAKFLVSVTGPPNKLLRPPPESRVHTSREGTLQALGAIMSGDERHNIVIVGAGIIGPSLCKWPLTSRLLHGLLHHPASIILTQKPHPHHPRSIIPSFRSFRKSNLWQSRAQLITRPAG